MDLKKLNKAGLGSFIVAITLIVMFSVGVESKLIIEESLLFYFLITTANIGLFIFLAVGCYFWVYYFNKIGKTLNPWAFLFYIGCSTISGYWAFHKSEKINEQ